MSNSKKMLLTYASKRGSTARYANRIGKLIRTKPVAISNVKHIDAEWVIMGIPFYSDNKVNSDVKDFLQRFWEELSTCKLAVFVVTAHKNGASIKEITKLLPQPPLIWVMLRNLKKYRDKKFRDKVLLQLGVKYKKMSPSDIAAVEAFTEKLAVLQEVR